MSLVSEVIGWLRIYVGGLPWRVVNRWLGRDRATGKLSPCVVLLRGGSEPDDRWEFSALLRGRGVSVRLVGPGGAGSGHGASMPRPIWAGVGGSMVDGAVARSVSRVDVRLDNGECVRPELLGQGFPARFFLAEVPSGRYAVAAAAYDADGQLKGEVHLWREPPSSARDRAALPAGPPPLDTGVELEVPSNSPE